MKDLIPFSQHPSFQSLLAAVKGHSDEVELIEVSGVPLALHEDLIATVSSEAEAGVMYAERDAHELRNYLETVFILELSGRSLSELVQLLINHEYSQNARVDSIGEFAVIGDILQIWPPGYEHPLRVSYFGEDFESAAFYDEIYGKQLHTAQTVLIGDLRAFESQALMSALSIPLTHQRAAASVVVFGGEALGQEKSRSIEFDFAYPSLYFRRFELLERDIERYARSGFEVCIYTSHEDILPDSLQKFVAGKTEELDAGVLSAQLNLLVLTDRELFGTVFLSRRTRHISSTQARKLLAELEGEIEIGDYVVHEDHGIGVYEGIKQETFEQKISLGFNEFKTNVIYEDYLVISYAQGDELLIPLSQIDKITKYIGPDDEEPRITRLGRTEWATITRKVKESVAAMAKELVEHYARRSLATVDPVPTEISPAMEEFLEAFPYNETEDQKRTEKEVYLDLNKNKPMNRLIVGDVGFGKTEVAMRAAFKVAETGKQVAVLCPTTVLAAQHLKVFSERFKGSGFAVAGLSRFAGSGRSVIEGLEKGTVQIVVGTHRLLSADVKFKNLGLIIIDEEQKFGVRQKEKLKTLEVGVHVLSMSATPIPRTLSMALSSIQEISLIQTPPEGRKSVDTIVARLDYQKIADAILAEVSRGGQVYYVHNRVQTIQSVYDKLQKLLPGVRFVFAHGQMPSARLEQVINDFYAGTYDVLICTTIIENGIDMQNVNTIIIEQAQNFGLGQLYQLRGRVGRGERQAHAYFFYEGEDVAKEDTPEEEIILGEKLLKQKRKHQKYKERLRAILDFQHLGSGFNLASRDLEIRGAGNLLGREQHGNISQIGYGLYMQLLAQEIERLKQLTDYE
ncbi:MAG: Transcription-repair-coupling factor [candidate division WS6 bacterium OLB20]|uniref:Transcription-repair-coupling factor n=1 Tax=candidate division WS6 bacterium OLB20 TaxID=1617426 RepID=A0A136M0N4_9BACT|nr:MAG: Transcription-repair-coupling factor [candidate division WS6 bacterium OLB20]